MYQNVGFEIANDIEPEYFSYVRAKKNCRTK